MKHLKEQTDTFGGFLPNIRPRNVTIKSVPLYTPIYVRVAKSFNNKILKTKIATPLIFHTITVTKIPHVH